MRRIALGLCALAFCWSAPAAANWQWSRWGMSLTELKRAAPGPVADHSDDAFDKPGSVVRAVAFHEAAGMQMIAAFGFDDAGALNRVMIAPRDQSRCAALQGSLRQQYGEPEGGTRSSVATGMRWRDAEGGNLMFFLQIGARCSIDYTPIPTRARSGL